MIKNIEQTVLMVGKTINCLTYIRRISALTAVMGDKRRAKTTIREQSQLLERMDANFFGTGFHKPIVETARTKKEFRVQKMTTNKPFGAAPHFQTKMGGERQFLQREWMNSTKTTVWW